MKIRFVSIYKHMKNTGFWYCIKPSIRKLWGGEIIHVGTNTLYIRIDFRRINDIQDFADALSYPKTWYILRKFKKK